MKELPPFDFVAFILPLMTAFAGLRISRWILGQKFEAQFGFGFRFAFGLGVGMLVFTQLVLLCALAGFNGAPLLAWTAIIGGAAEVVLRAMKLPGAWKPLKFQAGHFWLLLLVPLFYSWWVFGELSTLEGTLEYDANAFWVFKSKIFFLEQGRQLVNVLHQSNLGYMHNDYPLLVPCLYTLGYGAVGGVDEFVNKVWPFWMVVSLCLAILSLARVWQTPRPLPIAVVTLIAFLPATIQFIRNEGGTIPMFFCISLTTLLIVSALFRGKDIAVAALPLAFAVCFSTKLEGAIFAAFCACTLLPFCLRRGWLRDKTLWISAGAAITSLVPYGLYRLTKPVAHPESHWAGGFFAAPGSVLHHFPQVLFMNIFARFFSADFFKWQPNGEHLQWIGQWTGPGSLLNPELSVLPWLLIGLIVLSLIFRPRGRAVLGVLSVVTLGVFALLSFVIACMPHWDLDQMIRQACNISGRHFYPFMTALFLGAVALWFPDEKEELPAEAQLEQKPAQALTPKPKRRR